MGLDMYLYTEKYVSGYNFDGKRDVSDYQNLVKQFGAEKVVDPETPSATVQFCVAYWRKANQIHSWFVRECQDGVDECQKTWVPREKLVELRDTCQKVLDSIELVDGGELNQLTAPPKPSDYQPQPKFIAAPWKVKVETRGEMRGDTWNGRFTDRAMWTDLARAALEAAERTRP